jgi:hypothetical protein
LYDHFTGDEMGTESTWRKWPRNCSVKILKRSRQRSESWLGGLFYNRCHKNRMCDVAQDNIP